MSKLILKIWNWLFTYNYDNHSYLKIIKWWEIRRIPYNIMVLILGVISILLLYQFASLSGELKPGEDIIEPFLILISPILINIAYTTGWIAEIILKLIWKDKTQNIGPALMKLGVSFSIFTIYFPTIVWGITYLFTIFK